MDGGQEGIIDWVVGLMADLDGQLIVLRGRLIYELGGCLITH